jgi:hypothetical protein
LPVEPSKCALTGVEPHPHVRHAVHAIHTTHTHTWSPKPCEHGLSHGIHSHICTR